MKKILIADDDMVTRFMIRKLLEKGNFEVYEAIDGIEAIAKSKEIIPDLLILDIMMPGKSGFEVCRELRRTPDTKDIYILFISVRSGPKVEKTIETCGGNDFIGKPFSMKDLGIKIKKILGA